MRRLRKFSDLIAAAGVFILFANSNASASDQNGATPVELEDAVIQATLDGCVPNVLGDLPFVIENTSQMALVGLVPVEEEDGFASLPIVPFEDLHKQGLVKTSFAVRPSVTGRIILGATPRVAYCGIVVFDATAIQARENLIKAITEKGWKANFGGTVGDNKTFSADAKGKNILISVSGRDRASAKDAGYRILVTVAQTKD